jgi:hypothetical protein
MTSFNPETVLAEIRSQKLTLMCGKHRYTAARVKNGKIRVIPPEPNGCKECWEVYYITDFALTPPEKRPERLDELEEVIHHTVEYEQKGKFGKDFTLYEPGDPRFQVRVEKDAEPDKDTN